MRSEAFVLLAIFAGWRLFGTDPKEDLDVRKPVLDSSGKFWVYKDGESLDPPVPPYGLPFCPYGWMNVEMLQCDLTSREQPFSGSMCMSIEIQRWQTPFWAGIALISGPDQTMEGGPWWGATPVGWYHDLRGLERKRFVVHMRGARGGENIQFKVGCLAAETYGDSLRFPKASDWLVLTKDWKRYELDLSHEDLSRVCSLCFVISQAQQNNPDAPVRFFIDDAFFE